MSNINAIAGESRAGGCQPPAENHMDRGKLTVLAMLVLGLVAAAFAWWWRVTGN